MLMEQKINGHILIFIDIFIYLPIPLLAATIVIIDQDPVFPTSQLVETVAPIAFVFRIARLQALRCARLFVTTPPKCHYVTMETN